MSDERADIGLIGLAVMGQNLVLNMNDHGYRVAVYNRTTSTMRDFVEGPAAGTQVRGHEDLEAFVAALKRPRRVMLMVKAGKAVDAVIHELAPLLDTGDVIIDGGNSRHQDTTRRAHELREHGLLFVGTGVSGGEEGARHGPSIMPGGHPEAWSLVKDVLQAIAAKVDGAPCCDWVGPDGAGHFVKMVHNGIEYGDMQLIAEAYHLMDQVLGMDAGAIGDVFARWDEGRLDSYLIEITADIFRARDEDGAPLVEKILDAAGQKGTGKWTAVEALDHGVPLTLISEAVFARFLSALKDERVKAAKVLGGPGADATEPGSASQPHTEGHAGGPNPGAGAGGGTPTDEQSFVDDMVNDLEDALYASKIASYAQGYMLMRAAADAYDWDIDYGAVAQMWRGGCIIRSRFLSDIHAAYEDDPNLANVLLAPFFQREIDAAQAGWRRVVARAALVGVPVPAMASALAFYDGYRHARLPANLIQAQRDYFGAHTYERVDEERGKFFHTDWTGEGGVVTSGSYEG
ncbi:MAG: decarboxylating NADP(+)-dependent phosphogluconate dehydrogenase [Trueperaceae bacterium]